MSTQQICPDPAQFSPSLVNPELLQVTPLTARQRIFVSQFIKTGNATKSAIAAGYTKHSASRRGVALLADSKIKREIERLLTTKLSSLGVDADYVLLGVKEIVERCRQATPVLDKKGNPVFCEGPDGELVPAYQFDSAGALRGYELLGKHLKLWSDRLEIDIGGNLADLLDAARKRTRAELDSGALESGR